MYGVIKLDIFRNKFIRGNLVIKNVASKMKGNWLRWFGIMLRKDEKWRYNLEDKGEINLEEKWEKGGRLKKKWMEFIKESMRIYGVDEYICIE